MATPQPAVEPRNPGDAEAHIARIRKDKGLSESGNTRSHNVTDLESALSLLSEKLYAKDTHFLLELIQNADDNSYGEDVTPSLSITFGKDFLRLDCNEKGFLPNNVDAICRIGQSTKSGSNRTSGYIGEKGIGFKSVFKVADVVLVASKQYSFKFDKKQPLGMIAPIWVPPENFPGGIRKGHTSFHMQLSPGADNDNLAIDLRSLQPSLLIFLRRLRCIDVKIINHPRYNYQNNLTRIDRNGTVTKIIIVSEGDQSISHIVVKKVIDAPVEEATRPGVTQTELVLAFPFKKGEPYVHPQHVYAFLPIRHYGFQFLIQADFIMVASREDVDNSVPWNFAITLGLTDFLVDTFVEFVRRPIEGVDLRHTWIRYLPQEPFPFSFFKHYKEEMIKKLGEKNIIESQTEVPCTPASLVYVPAKFRDPRGVPMTFTPLNGQRYVSQKYLDADFKYLQLLGVREMTIAEFLRDLDSSSSSLESRVAFQKKSKHHHSGLAKILVPLLEDPEIMSQVRKLPLIRLRGGRWVSARESPIFFPGDNDDWSIPEGVDAMVVPSQQANDASIKLLYSQLGVVRLSQRQVAQLILTTHNSPSFKPMKLTLEDLISHAVFLFKADIKDIRRKRFYFQGENGTHHRGEDLYQYAKGEHTAASLFGRRSPFPFLHNDYNSAIRESNNEWCTWLHQTMGIWPIPRLVRSTSDTEFELSPHFESLIEKSAPVTILLLIKEHWQHYCKWIAGDKSIESRSKSAKAARSRLVESLSRMEVPCFGGILSNLGKTFLPLRDFPKDSSTSIPFLEVPDPEEEEWKYLEHLGVGVKNDVTFYLRWLQILASDQSREPSRPLMVYLFEQIQARATDNLELVKLVFQGNVIFIPSQPKGRPAIWTSAKSCLWKGPPFLQNYICLAPCYPDNGKLFGSILRLSNCQPRHLILAAETFQLGFPLQYIVLVLLALNERLQPDDDPIELRQLSHKEVFPIRRLSRPSPTGYDDLVSCKVDWFIADRKHFAYSFIGVVPLLSFDIDRAIEIDTLLERLGLNNRKLSQAAKVHAVTEAPVELHLRYTNVLRKKVDFFIRLIPGSKPERNQIGQQLRNLEVYAARGVQQRWSVQMGGETIQGRPSAGRVALHSDPKMLQIYLLKDNLVSEPPKSYFELADQLANFCGAEEKHKQLFVMAIIEDDHNMIKQHFDHAGIRNLIADEEQEFFYYRKDQENSGQGVFERVLKVAEGYATKKKIRIFANTGVGRPKGPKEKRKRSKRISRDDSETNSDTSDYYLVSSDEDSEDDSSSDDDGSGSDGNKVILAILTSGKLPRRKKTWLKENENIATAGELAVSGLLQSVMKEDYNPEYHWTSKRRNKIPYMELPPFQGDENSNASFTLSDVHGKFAKFLLDEGCPDAEHWLKRRPVYHLEVKSTEGGIESEFPFSDENVRRARKFSHNPQGVPSRSSWRANVCILIRVYDLDSAPEMRFYVDPWAKYLENSIKLVASSALNGRIRLDAGGRD